MKGVRYEDFRLKINNLRFRVLSVGLEIQVQGLAFMLYVSGFVAC